ncbi:MAG: FN3 associated domain-containing protein [Lachnospirales bacterium]
MKNFILKFLTAFAVILSLMCIMTITAYAADQAEVNGVKYWSHQTAWKKAIDSGGTFKLLGDWKPSSKDFGSDAVGDEKDYFANGAIRVPEGKSVTIDLNGHNISRNLYYSYNDPVSDGEVIYLERDAKLTIKDTSASGNGRIEDGNSSNGAGGIHAKPGSRIYMYSGAIGYCQSDKQNRGAAVYLDSGAMMYMYGGRIYSNKYTGSKGSSGIFVDDDARFYMYGGTIDNNKSEEEGAVYVNDTYALFQGGVIRNNYSEGYGSAVHCAGEDSEVYFNGTEFTGNTGGFAIFSKFSTITFSSGKIHNNPGGGVFINNGSKSPVFTGDAQIYGNKLTDGTFRDLWLGYDSAGTSAMVIFKDDIKETAKIGYSGGNVQISGNNEYDYLGNKYSKYVYSTNSDYRIFNRDDGSIVSWKKVSEIGEDSFITGISSVKDKSGSVSYTCDVDKDIRSVTIHVPQDADTSALAIGLNTTGVATEAATVDGELIQPITPSADIYTDFKTTEYGNTRAFTLLNADKKTQQNWTITVQNDMEVPSYSVTVNSGTGSGTYKRNTEVTVSANTVENKRFTKWNAEGVTLSEAQENTESMTFTMPDNDVTLTAEYKDLENKVELIIDEPYGGKALDSYATINLSDGTSAELPISWSPSLEKADFESTYTAVITVASEYGFSSNLVATVNGNVADIRKPDSKTAAITYTFTTNKAKLISISKSEIEFANGTALSDLVLPSEVSIVTENEAVSKASVTWNEIPSSAYDPNSVDEQKFTVDGVVTLPETIDQNEISLNIQIEVTILEADRVSAPKANLISGTTYEESQKLTLSSDTIGANIYYTTDGTKPSKDNGTLYTSPITLKGEINKNYTYNIKAIALQDDNDESRISDFTFNVFIPVPTYEVKIVDENGNTAGLGNGRYHEGDEVTVQTIKMADKYIFKNWKVAEGELQLDDDQVTASVFTFTMPNCDVTLTPVFLDAITNIELDIASPVAGTNLDTKAGYKLYSSDTLITQGSDILTISWNPAYAVAKGKTIYTAALTMLPNANSNILFSDSITLTVANATYTLCNKNADGSVTLQCIFPETGVETTSLVSITNPGDLYIPNEYYDEETILEVLPNTVKIETTNSSINYATVEWQIPSDFYGYYEFDEYYFSDAVYYLFEGTVTLPEGIDANGIDTKAEMCVCIQNDFDYAYPPMASVVPGVYFENQTVALSVIDTTNIKEIRYTLDGTEPSRSNGLVYSEPITLEGANGANTDFTIKAIAVPTNSDYTSSTQVFNYTINLPTKEETVTVINGTGSGSYSTGSTINIVARPATGTAFKNWVAESVTYTTDVYEKTETILDENGNPKEVTISGTITTRNATVLDNVLENSSLPVTSLTVPYLDEGSVLEVTAECINSITSVSLKADVPKYGKPLPTEITPKTEGVNVVENSFSITPNDTNANVNGEYTITATLSIDENYALGENVAFSVNGTYVTPKINDDGTYTVSYTYKTSKITADVNKDGKTDEIDAALVLRHLSEISILTDEQQAIADVDGYGIDLIDVTAILKSSN